jgi:predicted acylesterase/phospholipase RssA/CRP-like cAMP-binding protein
MTTPLPTIALFDGIDSRIVEELLAELPTRKLSTGEYLCHEGEGGRSMFILRRGLARVEVGDDKTTVGRLRRGDVVGEMSMLTGEPRTASVVASVPTDVLEFDRDTFTAAIGRHPELLENLTRILSERLAQTTRSQGERAGRGEAITLVVGPGLVRVAREVVEAVGRTSPGSVATVDLSDTEVPASDKVEEVVGALDDQLAANRTVAIVAPSDFGKLDLLTLHTDRTLVLAASEADAGRIVGRLRADPPLAEFALVDAADPAGEDIDGFPIVRSVDTSEPRDVRWLGRHLAGTKLGLALGAGGAKGYAHVGALRVLEEAGYEIDYVAGSSIGAIIGACMGMGMDSHAIEASMRKMFTEDNVKQLFSLSFAGTSAGGDTMKAMLLDLVGDRTFADLSIPLVVMTVDLGAKLPEPIDSGPVLDALLAATALAGFVPPFRRGDQRLIDALALVPVPSETVRSAGADITVSVNIMSRRLLPAWPGLEPPETKDKKERMLEVLLDVMDLGQLDASVRHAAMADVPMTPEFGPATWRDFELADRFLAAGREAALEQLPDLQARSRPSVT